MIKHTKGPWYAAHHIDHSADGFTLADVGTWQVRAAVDDVSPDEGESNAKLIAAAPSLADALEGVRSALAALPFKDTAFLTKSDAFMVAYRQMNAALRAAGRLPEESK